MQSSAKGTDDSADPLAPIAHLRTRLAHFFRDSSSEYPASRINLRILLHADTPEECFCGQSSAKGTNDRVVPLAHIAHLRTRLAHFFRFQS